MKSITACYKAETRIYGSELDFHRIPPVLYTELIETGYKHSSLFCKKEKLSHNTPMEAQGGR
jgi:hypothetical protein